MVQISELGFEIIEHLLSQPSVAKAKRDGLSANCVTLGATPYRNVDYDLVRLMSYSDVNQWFARGAYQASP